HIGAHWGTVLYREGDYYGNGVNLAARIASSTDPDQFLISQDLADAANPTDAVGLAPLSPRELKGVDRPIHVFEVRPRGRATSCSAPTTRSVPAPAAPAWPTSSTAGSST